MSRLHRYQMTITWTGNLGSGTSQYTAYSRNPEISAAKKAAPIQGSSDPLFRGDPTRYNPENLLVGALSACHMLWVLHLCADADIGLALHHKAHEVCCLARSMNFPVKNEPSVLTPTATQPQRAFTQNWVRETGHPTVLPGAENRCKGLIPFMIASTTGFRHGSCNMALDLIRPKRTACGALRSRTNRERGSAPHSPCVLHMQPSW